MIFDVVRDIRLASKKDDVAAPTETAAAAATGHPELMPWSSTALDHLSVGVGCLLLFLNGGTLLAQIFLFSGLTNYLLVYFASLLKLLPKFRYIQGRLTIATNPLFCVLHIVNILAYADTFPLRMAAFVHFCYLSSRMMEFL
jgi:hypothetical protein